MVFLYLFISTETVALKVYIDMLIYHEDVSEFLNLKETLICIHIFFIRILHFSLKDIPTAMHFCCFYFVVIVALSVVGFTLFLCVW